MDRLARNWVYGGALAGLLLLALAPLVLAGWPAAFVAVFLQLPVYMLHQYEEHDDDRFARFLAERFGGGHPVLSRFDIFVVNIPGVWGVNLISIWLAAWLGVGFGLIGVYLTVVNGLVHIGQGIALRRYNPGLATAILMFLPLGIWALWEVQATGAAELHHHALGLLLAVLIHAAIVARAARNRRLAA